VGALGQYPGGVRRHQGDGGLDETVRREAKRPARHDADQQADDDSAQHREEEQPRRLAGHEAAGDDGRDGHPEEHKGRGVVDQALPLENRDQAMRDAQRSGDRGHGHGIGGRDDRAQHEGGGPAQPRDDRPGHDGDGDCCGGHQAHGEEHDRAQIRPEVAE
jgi:hypothetical protein